MTVDGRLIVGELKGFDQTGNLILTHSEERVFSTEEGMQTVPLGLYMIRGDTTVSVGLIDVELDDAEPWSERRAQPLPNLTL
ncbi:U6 snRNA-associated Sm-like protein LSm8 [Conidiobolus coronatus NRRL 28638]|uniref:LSM2-LSM8 complex subunit LSM8 n=1 Tax=Conidiobolus coronatus (strain ATCC 28846 / CBS 209.66 / NRRL 28638) TaxID=796925 RepID=A0A137P8T7_CONC2|nr:U6 snRNA-associated Sm-like protein LSm8 [Conidiobolus coronatus NRRL 28638]|eukprot:KXN71392.1 U6 snRNA-associated Sm-like protein LSm8 [Conidiobolus coronatus NRRL 28638]